MQNKPLTVYLDNADYSALSNPKELEKSPQKQAALQYLKDKVSDGGIEIRYSVLILGESMHHTKDARPYALERAKLIQELCNGKCFRPIQCVYTEDAIAYCRERLGHPKSHSTVLSDDNDWLNLQSSMTFMSELRLEMKASIQEVLRESSLNRAQRKQQEKLLFSRGQLTPLAIQNLRENGALEKLPTEHGSMYLADFADPEVFTNWVAGKISDSEAQQKIMARMLRATFLFDKMTSYDDEMRTSLRKFINKQGINLLKLLEKLDREINEATLEVEKLGYDVDKGLSQFLKRVPLAAYDGRKSALLSLYKSDEKNISKAGINESQWNDIVVESELGSIPSVDMTICLWRDMLIKRLKDKNNKNSQSDGLDVLHASYAHHCDIMRVDKRTYVLLEKLKKENSRIKTVFVKKPEDLPSTIETMLKAQKQAA